MPRFGITGDHHGGVFGADLDPWRHQQLSERGDPGPRNHVPEGWWRCTAQRGLEWLAVVLGDEKAKCRYPAQQVFLGISGLGLVAAKGSRGPGFKKIGSFLSTKLVSHKERINTFLAFLVVHLHSKRKLWSFRCLNFPAFQSFGEVNRPTCSNMFPSSNGLQDERRGLCRCAVPSSAGEARDCLWCEATLESLCGSTALREDRKIVFSFLVS